MHASKRIGIILPSFKDKRIADAIRSIRHFDDADTVKLIVIDGGSGPELCDMIRSQLTPDDVLVSEPDRGIFDALNKGLDLCDTEYIGWIGSDDLFTGQVLASDVLRALEMHDIFVASAAVFNGTRVRRLTHSRPAAMGLVRFGLHNPHYATFGRAGLLKSDYFELDLLAADIAYFIRIFARRPRVLSTPRVATLAGEGGFSTKSHAHILRVNKQLLDVYGRATNPIVAPFALALKLGYKLWSTAYYRLFPKERFSLEIRQSRGPG